MRINLASGIYTTKQGLENRIQGILESIEDTNHTPDFSNSTDFISRFEKILNYICKKHNKKVVVLIDEYDKPILTSLVIDKDVAESNRVILSNFFGVLKDYLKNIFDLSLSLELECFLCLKCIQD